MQELFLKRTWIDIDLDTVKSNYRSACGLTKSKMTAVIKSNAYGHGAVRIAQALNEEGCRSFAVACAREALELRDAGIQGEILVMGLTEKELLSDVMGKRITMTVADDENLQAIDDAAGQAGQTAVVHLKINTGFYRLGYDVSEEIAKETAAVIRRCPHIFVEGIYSHLGLINPERDAMQHDKLMQMKAWVEQYTGAIIPETHLCDSIGLVRYPEWHHSRVRAGAFLFGVRPSRSEHMPFTCNPTIALRTTIAQIHEVPAGEIVGYGDDMILDYDARIATLCAGYGDGYPRCLSNGNGWVSVNGKRAQVVGLVCMDQMMVDVTNIPDAKPGDTVTLLGGDIGYSEYSDWAHTNRNECITILSRRPVRVYHEQGKIVTVLDELLHERKDYHD